MDFSTGTTQQHGSHLGMVRCLSLQVALITLEEPRLLRLRWGLPRLMGKRPVSLYKIMTQKYPHNITQNLKISWKFVEKRWYTRWVWILILCFCWKKKLPPSSSILRPEQGGRNEGAKKVTWTKSYGSADLQPTALWSEKVGPKPSLLRLAHQWFVNLSKPDTSHFPPKKGFRISTMVRSVLDNDDPWESRIPKWVAFVSNESLVKVHATWRWLCRTCTSAWGLPTGCDCFGFFHQHFFCGPTRHSYKSYKRQSYQFAGP